MPKKFVGDSFTVALISGSEKVWIGGGNYQDFPSYFFCLTVPKISVRKTLLLHYFRVAKKFGEEVGWGVSRFCVEFFLSHSAENLRRESFTVALLSGTEKIWRRGGVSRFFVENFLSRCAEKFRVGILYC